MDVVALALRALEGSAHVITWSCATESDLVLDLRQRSSVEVSRDGGLEGVEVVSCEAFSTPRPLARGATPTGMTIIRADNA